MNPSLNISVELAAWLQMQITLATAKATAPIADELRQVRDFSDGLFAALVAVLPAMLQHEPELAEAIAPEWQQIAQRFDELKAGAMSEDEDDCTDLLEPRAVLYRIGEIINTWPQMPTAGRLRRVPTRRK